MIFLPKIGSIVIVTKKKEGGYLSVGSVVFVEDLLTYENPILVGMVKVKLLGRWYESGCIRKLSFIEKLAMRINLIFYKAMNV